MIVLATLAIGLPIVFVLAIRFLWERQLNLGRSKELEKLIWQLHRIASAMEHQMNLSYPPVQPGTEEARDLAYLKQVAVPGSAPARGEVPAVTVAANAVAASAPATRQPVVQPQAQVATLAATAQQAPIQAAEETPAPLPPLQERHPGEVVPRAGVSSMFGL
jgi:hypothetical protein